MQVAQSNHDCRGADIECAGIECATLFSLQEYRSHGKIIKKYVQLKMNQFVWQDEVKPRPINEVVSREGTMNVTVCNKIRRQSTPDVHIFLLVETVLTAVTLQHKVARF